MTELSKNNVVSADLVRNRHGVIVYACRSQIDPYLRKIMDCCLLHQITSYHDTTVFYRYCQGWIREAYDTKGRPIFMIGTRDELLFRSIREAWVQQHVIQLG